MGRASRKRRCSPGAVCESAIEGEVVKKIEFKEKKKKKMVKELKMSVGNAKSDECGHIPVRSWQEA